MNHSLLRLLQLVSPTLPVGAFAYSQGLEFAVDSGWIKNADETEQWLVGLMQNNLAALDLPIALRIYQALKNQHDQQLDYWNQYALASRETQELRLESIQLAKALLRLLNDMGEDTAVLQQQQCDWSAAFALAASRWEIAEQEMLLGYVWSWLENQLAAAIKLVPLGQTQGQILLQKIAMQIPKVIAVAKEMKDDDIGALAPAMVIASCQHETQYSRLFRS